MGQANTSKVFEEEVEGYLLEATPAERDEFRRQQSLSKDYFKDYLEELEKKRKKKRKDDARRKAEKLKHEQEEGKRKVPYLTYKAKVGALEDCIEGRNDCVFLIFNTAR